MLFIQLLVLDCYIALLSRGLQQRRRRKSRKLQDVIISRVLPMSAYCYSMCCYHVVSQMLLAACYDDDDPALAELGPPKPIVFCACLRHWLTPRWYWSSLTSSTRLFRDLALLVLLLGCQCNTIFMALLRFYVVNHLLLQNIVSN